MQDVLQTERLTLRPFRPEDVEAFHAIWGDPEVIWWGANESLAVTREGFERLLARHEAWPPGIGWLAVCPRGEDDILGDILLQPAPFVDGIEIGWHFRRDAWGRGYATEAARAVLQRAFAERVVERLYAIVALQNPRSLRIVEKLGFSAVEDREYAGLPHRLFALDRTAG
ncbi:MAG: GNAT family N-acetyltransferase [Planctomycetota bacterium]|nr:GNAT family N-acetyltransferase [Planctomycetota bacterium]